MDTTLRGLRKYHWNKALAARSSASAHYKKAQTTPVARTARYHQRQGRRYDAQANMHLGFVVSLNDVPELAGTTAEKDCQ